MAVAGALRRDRAAPMATSLREPAQRPSPRAVAEVLSGNRIMKHASHRSFAVAYYAPRDSGNHRLVQACVLVVGVLACLLVAAPFTLA